jgi:hypothetical protein
MNRAILVGNLTRDPEHRTTPSDLSVTTFSIAVQRRFTQGEQKADFFNIVTWRSLADNCAKYLQKGSKVGIAGAIQTRSYDDKNGIKRYVTEIVADEDDCQAELLFEGLDGFDEKLLARAVEAGGGLVEDEDLRARGKRAVDKGALELAAADGRNIELTVAHETAHQWFGDAVTEAQWRDLWLSEGFATYFAALFVEHADGVASFRQVLEDERRRIVEPKHTSVAIVDARERDLFKLLNIENYDKASWVLHMLRGLLGDDRFFDGIRRYYRDHEHRTATTADLQHAMETASGMRLDAFFDQWLFHPGFPRFRVSSRWDAGQRTATVIVDQVQPGNWPTFTMPVTIELTTPSGPIRRRIDVHERTERITVPLDAPPVSIVLDPDGWVLKDLEPR